MAEHETIADVIAWLRRPREGENAYLTLWRDEIADGLDAAHKREIDVLKQRCAELNAEVAAKDEVIKRLNDAIAEEQRRKMATTEKSSVVGDAAKLREALKATLDLFWDIHNANRSPQSNQAYAVIRQIKAALTAPPRNCDVGTAEEQAQRFYKFCMVNSSAIQGMCNSNCPCIDSGDKCHCLTKWAQLPYESEAADGE